MEEGDNAALTFEGHDLKGTYVFEGEKAPAVKYLNTVSLVALPDQDYALPFDEYKTRLDAKAADAVKLLKANGLSSAGDFEENEEDRIRYSYATPLIMYPMAHRIMAISAARSFVFIPPVPSSEPFPSARAMTSGVSASTTGINSASAYLCGSLV